MQYCAGHFIAKWSNLFLPRLICKSFSGISYGRAFRTVQWVLEVMSLHVCQFKYISFMQSMWQTAWTLHGLALNGQTWRSVKLSRSEMLKRNSGVMNRLSPNAFSSSEICCLLYGMRFFLWRTVCWWSWGHCGDAAFTEGCVRNSSLARPNVQSSTSAL